MIVVVPTTELVKTSVSVAVAVEVVETESLHDVAPASTAVLARAGPAVVVETS